jgi:hypothetical protein
VREVTLYEKLRKNALNYTKPKNNYGLALLLNCGVTSWLNSLEIYMPRGDEKHNQDIDYNFKIKSSEITQIIVNMALSS